MASQLPLQDTLDIAVREFVSLASGLDSSLVIPGDDNHPAPNEPYATVENMITIGVGIDSEVPTDGPTTTETTLKHKGTRSISYSVQFFREGAADNAEGLLSYASTTLGQLFLAQNNLTWKRAGDVRNIGAVMGSKNEERRAVDIELRYISRRTIDINRIGSVEIDFTMSDSTDINEVIEVTDA